MKRGPLCLKSIFPLFLLLVGQATAVTELPFEFENQVTKNTKEISKSLHFNGDIPIRDFRDAILDANNYPLTGKAPDGSLVLAECTLIDRVGSLYIVYQRTGAGIVKARQYVFALWVDKETAEEVVIEWLGVKHIVAADGHMEGPYAAKLNEHAADSVYPPYKAGRWIYNRGEKKITYQLLTDPGGRVPKIFLDESVVLIFPKELLKQKWGIDAKFE